MKSPEFFALPSNKARVRVESHVAFWTPPMTLKKTMLFAALLAWATGVGWGFFLIWQYEATPGPSGELPVSFSNVAQTDGPKTLIMLAHPHCPCTRASLAELERIMSRSQGRIQAHVYFLQPEQFPPSWSQGESWDMAAALPGVQVHADVGGRKAKELGALTSGHVVVLDDAGRLLFSGGITGARGHQGDNPGRQAVLDLLHGNPVMAQECPVFGCPLFDPRATCCKDPS
jgi:hypothetical protein